MPIDRAINPRKSAYREKLLKLLDEYQKVLLCTVDFVGSNQLQQIRIALRGRAVILLGKNTVVRKVMRERVEQNPTLDKLIPNIRGNIGLIFTNADLKEIREVVQSNKVPAAAKAGILAPNDVFIPPGPTSLDPGQTNFFQALDILTKINRGAIEIINEVHLIKANEKVSASAVALLSKLNIKPFTYSVKVTHAFEGGSFYPSSILDLSQADLLAKFFKGVRRVAAVSLAVNYPTLASLPHVFANAFKKLLAISLVTDYTFEQAKAYKEYLADPSKFAAAVAPAAASSSAPAASSSSAKAPAKEEPKEEEEESSDFAGGGLFGDDD